MSLIWRENLHVNVRDSLGTTCNIAVDGRGENCFSLPLCCGLTQTATKPQQQEWGENQKVKARKLNELR